METELEVVNERTGEISNPNGEMVPASVDKLQVETSPYSGASMQPFTDDQISDVSRPILESEILIKPTGEIYVAQVTYRRILNKAFKPGGWALVPRGPWTKMKDIIYREYALVVAGRFISEAVGAQEYFDNKRMTYADATEGAKSDALKKACKDIGIASECWDKSFCEKFIEKNCIQVWVKDKNTGKNKTQWRRKDFKAFYNETGEVKPNDKNEYEPEPTQTAQRSNQAEKSEPSQNEDKITDGQKKLLYFKLKNAGMVEDDVKINYNVEHLSDLKKSDMNDILTFIESGKVDGESQEVPF